jgi:hypothetical protein
MAINGDQFTKYFHCALVSKCFVRRFRPLARLSHHNFNKKLDASGMKVQEGNRLIHGIIERIIIVLKRFRDTFRKRKKEPLVRLDLDFPH